MITTDENDDPTIGRSQVETYIGCKIIRATEEMKDGGEGYKVIYPDGYVSWSPKATFEEAYRLVSDGEISLVLEGR